MLSAESDPQELFKMLFAQDSPETLKESARRLKEGKRIMDVIGADATRLQKSVGREDRERLDEFFTSVNDLDADLANRKKWLSEPKPTVEMTMPDAIKDANQILEKQELMLKLVHLAFETDSTRYATMFLDGSSRKVSIKGVENGYHFLSHHGRNEEKLEQLALIEEALIAQFGRQVRRLKASGEGAGTLLDSTAMLFTSNLGNASSHRNDNVPVILAGGRFEHGQHLAFDRGQNQALAEVFLSLLHSMELPKDSWTTGTKPLPGLQITA